MNSLFTLIVLGFLLICAIAASFCWIVRLLEQQ